MKQLLSSFEGPTRPVFALCAARLACALALVGLLTGCWMSQGALIGIADASTVPFEGPYKPEKEDVVVEVTHNPGGSYSLIDNKGEGFTAFFMEVQDGWYVVQHDFKALAGPSAASQAEGEQAQASPDAAARPHLYNLMQLSGKDLKFHLPDCDEATQAVPGVTLDAQTKEISGTCSFASLAAVQQAARQFIGRVEAGGIKQEPGVLRSIAGGPQ